MKQVTPALKVLWAFGLVALARAVPARADFKDYKPPVYIKVGSKAPVFEGTTDTGGKWWSRDHVGRKAVVVCFLMSDFFPDCTREACSLRDEMTRLRAAGAEVVVVTGDSVATHRRFKKKYGLNFPLVADYKGEACAKFGLPMSGGGVQVVKDGGKEVRVERGVTPPRATYVFDKDGWVAYLTTDVKPATHGKDVLAVVKKLKARR